MNGKLTTAIILVSLFFTSCATSYTSRTAKTVEIANGIIQMPTVVDLRVDSTVVKRDTVWTTTPFKRGGSLKTKIQTVTGDLLESAGADVLLQPTVAHDVTQKCFKSTHHLTVSGYPAHYGNFRTITIDDVKAINGMYEGDRPLIADYRTAMTENRVKSGGLKGLVQPIKSVFNKSLKVSKPKIAKPEIKTGYQRKKGYTGMVDGGFILGLDGPDAWEISTTHGYQVGNYFFAGLGLGYFNYETEVYDRYSYHTIKNDALPVYLNLRGYLMKRRVSPYIEGRFGVDVLEALPYVNAGLGVSIGHFEVGAAYTYLMDSFEGIKIKVGFKF